MRIVDANEDIYDFKKVGTDKYDVIKNGSPTYVIEKHGAQFQCSCPGYQFRHKCRHIELFNNEMAAPVSKRHPIAEFKKYLPVFERLLKGYNWEIVGSYRRGATTYKDADVCIDMDINQFHDLAKRMVDEGFVKDVSKDSIIRGSLNGIPVDFYRPETHKSWTCLLVTRTGSKEFNIYLRAWWKKKTNAKGGINEKYIQFADGTKMYPSSEQEFFKLLGLPYIKPSDRDAGKFEKFFKGK